ncbi:MAG: hypothetical protein ABIV07_08660, partial [Polaromonas sp.]
MTSTASGGESQPGEAHSSQCAPARGASPDPPSAALARSVFTLQMPLNWPLRTSSASIDTGAHKANSTAR